MNVELWTRGQNGGAEDANACDIDGTGGGGEGERKISTAFFIGHYTAKSVMPVELSGRYRRRERVRGVLALRREGGGKEDLKQKYTARGQGLMK